MLMREAPFVQIELCAPVEGAYTCCCHHLSCVHVRQPLICPPPTSGRAAKVEMLGTTGLEHLQSSRADLSMKKVQICFKWEVKLLHIVVKRNILFCCSSFPKQYITSCSICTFAQINDFFLLIFFSYALLNEVLKSRKMYRVLLL